MIRVRLLLVVLSGGTVTAASGFLLGDQAPGPPVPVASAPNPAAGERHDGRIHQGPALREDLLLIPRLVLFVPRLLLKGLSYPVYWVAAEQERHLIFARAMAFLTSDDGGIGVLPALAYIASLQPTFGATFFDKHLLGRNTRIETTVMVGGLTLLLSALARPTAVGRPFQLDLTGSYTRRPDGFFAGIGSLSSRGGSRYQFDAVDVSALPRFLIARGWSVGLLGQFGLRRFANGKDTEDNPSIEERYCLQLVTNKPPPAGCVPGTVDERLVPGFARGTQFLRTGASVRLDQRDSPTRSASGVLINLAAQYSHGLGPDDSSYLRTRGSVGTYLDLWQRSRVVVLRLTVDVLSPFGSAPVPFSEFPWLGGPDSLRGFRPGWYRDFSSVLASVEYRWPLWMWMDATIFADYGGVFGQHFADFTFSAMHPDIGFGVRVVSSSQFFLRVQTAYGFGPGGGWQFFVSGGP